MYSVYKTDLLPTNYLYTENVHKGTDEQHDPNAHQQESDQPNKRKKTYGMHIIK